MFLYGFCLIITTIVLFRSVYSVNARLVKGPQEITRKLILINIEKEPHKDNNYLFNPQHGTINHNQEFQNKIDRRYRNIVDQTKYNKDHNKYQRKVAKKSHMRQPPRVVFNKKGGSRQLSGGFEICPICQIMQPNVPHPTLGPHPKPSKTHSKNGLILFDANFILYFSYQDFSFPYIFIY